MTTITEDYVSFEIAKLLKEKGFNEGCNSYFISDNEIALIPNRRDFNNHGVYLSAPTQQMVMQWLRDVHDIFIKLEYDVDEDIQWHPSLALIKGNKYIHTNELQWYDTYEQACEAAIKYCLKNLI
jgi:hypothetical protein